MPLSKSGIFAVVLPIVPPGQVPSVSPSAISTVIQLSIRIDNLKGAPYGKPTEEHNPSPPQTQGGTKVVRSDDKTVAFALDNGCLLVKLDSLPYPCPVDAVATLALANMLKIHYESIVDEARKHQQHLGGKEHLTNATRT